MVALDCLSKAARCRFHEAIVRIMIDEVWKEEEDFKVQEVVISRIL
jgi:hypothetical protein